MWSRSSPMAASAASTRSCRQSSKLCMRSRPPREPPPHCNPRVLHCWSCIRSSPLRSLRPATCGHVLFACQRAAGADRILCFARRSRAGIWLTSAFACAKAAAFARWICRCGTLFTRCAISPPMSRTCGHRMPRAPRRRCVKSKTSEWEITAPAGCVVVSYDIHLDVPGPFGSTLNADHGFFNWAMVLMYSPGSAIAADEHPTAGYSHSVGAARVHVLGGGCRRARSNRRSALRTAMTSWWTVRPKSALFSSPSFKQDGATYHIVVDGNPADYDMAKLDEILPQDHPCRSRLDAGPSL